MLGRKTVEAEILKDALEIAAAKVHLAHCLVAAGLYPVGQIACALGIQV